MGVVNFRIEAPSLNFHNVHALSAYRLLNLFTARKEQLGSFYNEGWWGSMNTMTKDKPTSRLQTVDCGQPDTTTNP